MSNKFPLVVSFILLIVTVLFLHSAATHPNNTEKNVKCTILKGYQTTSENKDSHSIYYKLLLRDDKNRIFTVNVSLETFYTANKKNNMSFMLSENDITGKTSQREKIYTAFGVISLFLFICFGVYSFVVWIDD